MANHKSAIKRAKQNEKKRIRNKGVKTTVKSETRKFLEVVEEKKGADEVKAALNTAVHTLARAGSKGVLHKKTASRRIGRLVKRANKAAS